LHTTQNYLFTFSALKHWATGHVACKVKSQVHLRPLSLAWNRCIKMTGWTKT